MMRVVTTLALVCLVGLGDFLTGPEVAFGWLYLVPIAYGSWFLGRPFGLFVTLLSIASWVGNDFLARAPPLPLSVEIWNVVAQLGAFAAFSLMLTELKIRLARERLYANTDPLTDIKNRRAFYEAAEIELERMRRYQRPLTVAYVDLDNFKLVNDQYGHEVGDEVLRLIAHELQSSIRPTDVVARLGGDEFGLLLPETGEEMAKSILARLEIHVRTRVAAKNWNVTCSIGAVSYEHAPENVGEMVRLADRMMYAAKDAGKNTVQLGTMALYPRPAPVSRDRAVQ
jgi:diguanylate cyclase (GGDEF)-like protein